MVEVEGSTFRDCFFDKDDCCLIFQSPSKTFTVFAFSRQADAPKYRTLVSSISGPLMSVYTTFVVCQFYERFARQRATRQGERPPKILRLHASLP